MAINMPSFDTVLKLVKAGATVEAQEKIMELRQAVMSLQEENLALRMKVQELDARLTAVASPKFPPCPVCRRPAWKMETSEDDPMTAIVGGKHCTYRCGECGHSDTRLEFPGG